MQREYCELTARVRVSGLDEVRDRTEVYSNIKAEIGFTTCDNNRYRAVNCAELLCTDIHRTMYSYDDTKYYLNQNQRRKHKLPGLIQNSTLTSTK